MGIFRNIYNTLFRHETTKYDDSNPEFSLWAFGEDYKTLSAIQKMQTWNRLHGELITLNPADDIHKSLCKMGGFWVLHCQNEPKNDDNSADNTFRKQ
jgi:hypothetical protein